MRGVQDTYGVPGYADNRKPGVYSPAMRLCFPIDTRLSYFAGLGTHTFSDSAVYPQTWTPEQPAEQLTLQQLAAEAEVFKGHQGLLTSAPHGRQSRMEEREQLSPLFHFVTLLSLEKSAFNRRREG